MDNLTVFVAINVLLFSRRSLVHFKSGIFLGGTAHLLLKLAAGHLKETSEQLLLRSYPQARGLFLL